MPIVASLLLFPAPDDVKNPWRDKVAAAVERVERDPTPAAFESALDIAWRADDWQAGAQLARDARKRHPDNMGLRGLAVRALWRAGRIEEAEELAAAIGEETEHRPSLAILIQIASARGQHDRASALADRLERLDPQTTTEMSAILGARLRSGAGRDMAGFVRRIAAITKPENGYPDVYVAESIEGLAEFFAAVGDEPLNQVVDYGSADMPLVPMLYLPGVDAMVNGKGPYRFIVDTGGSITLSLDTEVAEELGLKSIASATIRGVSGKQPSGQVVVDELRIGEIRLKRVMTRTWEFPTAMKAAVSGIIGTGMFDRNRMTLDFHGAKLVVSRSSDKPADGQEASLRIVGDGKLIAPIRIADAPAVALIDSGAGTTAISPARLAELFPDRKQRGLRAPVLGAGGDGPVAMSFAPGVDVTMFGRRYPSLSLVSLDVLDDMLSPILGVQIDLLSGMLQLREMRSLTVDLSTSRMWVDWLAAGGREP